MKERIIDLYPKKGYSTTATRVFAVNQAAALATVRKLYPQYNTVSVKPSNL